MTWCRWVATIEFRCTRAYIELLLNFNVLKLTEGSITHLYHGSQRNRNYAGRVRYLTDHDFDPTTDLARDDNGLWKWATNKPEMHRLVAHYFTQRREDDCRPGMAIVAQ